VIGTIRRECLDHVIVGNEVGLSRHLRRFADYYHRSRTHLACRRTRPSHDLSKRQKPGESSRSPRWAGSIIGTNVAPLEPRTPVELGPSNKLR
jgi:hypothetical protein